MSYFNDGQQYPVRGRQCSSQQVPIIQEKYKTYNDFAKATLGDIYGEFGLEESRTLMAQNFASVYLENIGKGKFKVSNLPNRAQISPVNTSLILDFDDDGRKDVLVAGNLFTSEVETPRADAGVGLLIKHTKNIGFEPIAPFASGFNANGDVKQMKTIRLANNSTGILVAQNNGPLKLFILQ